MKNPRRLPGILDVTYQTLPERELFWNLGIPGIFLSWSGNSSAFSRIRRGRFQKSSKLQKNSRSGRVWSVTSRITGKGRGFFIILYKHFLQCSHYSCRDVSPVTHLLTMFIILPSSNECIAYLTLAPLL